MNKSTSNMFVFNVFLATVLVFTVMYSAAVVGDTPTPPQNFYGTLTINSNPAPTGTEVRGMVGVVDKTYQTYATGTEGVYGSASLANPQFLVDCENGELINFAVEVSPGTFANADQTYECDRGALTELDLIVSIEDCSTHSQTSCEADPSCDWCATCDNYYWSGYVTDTCVDAGACTHGCCSVDNCGAECDPDNDCLNNTCSVTFDDYCNDTKLVEYDANKIMDSTSVNNSCENSCLNCTCENCTVDCPAPQTSTYCVIGTCGAQCDSNDDCNATECGIDQCIGDDYYDYTDIDNDCLDNCACETNTCSAPNITYDDPQCIIAEICNNGIDDDGDGDIDCADDDCFDTPPCDTCPQYAGCPTEYNFTLDLDDGMSLVAIPINDSGVTDAATLCDRIEEDLITDCIEIIKWDSTAGYTSYVDVAGTDNFPIIGGEGYFINIDSAGIVSVTFTGQPWGNPVY